VGSDAITGDAVAAPVAPARGRSLTKHATLNAVASLIDYATRGAVGFIVTPILVGALGRSLYGVWEMLNRLFGYMSAADGRPTEALRLVIANRQSVDDATKRRYVGATLAVWAITLPIVLVVGTALAWIAPIVTKVGTAERQGVHIACGLLVGYFLATTLATVPESVLRGMNMGYKRMGLQSGLSIIAGVLSAVAVTAGLGVPGLAGSFLVRAVLTGLCFWVLARSYVSWFGVAKPHRSEIKALLGMSIWLAVGDAIAKLLLASDVLILGAVVSPALVTTYTLTSFAARTGLGIHVYAASAAMPGIGSLIGKGELSRAANARAELLTLTWLFAVTVGAVILLWNRSFLGLWVGPQHYAGVWIDLLVVLATLQSAFIRTDSYIIDAALQPRARTTVGTVAAAITIAAGIVLTQLWGLPGLCLSIILGRATQSIAYPVLARRHLGKTHSSAPHEAIRLALVGSAILVSAVLIGQQLRMTGWIGFATGVVASVIAVGAVALYAGPSSAARRAVIRRVAALRPGRWAR
jgi:O-antigen/teichoic acid export membrane protein